MSPYIKFSIQTFVADVFQVLWNVWVVLCCKRYLVWKDTVSQTFYPTLISYFSTSNVVKMQSTHLNTIVYSIFKLLLEIMNTGRFLLRQALFLLKFVCSLKKMAVFDKKPLQKIWSASFSITLLLSLIALISAWIEIQ